RASSFTVVPPIDSRRWALVDRSSPSRIAKHWPSRRYCCWEADRARRFHLVTREPIASNVTAVVIFFPRLTPPTLHFAQSTHNCAWRRHLHDRPAPSRRGILFGMFSREASAGSHWQRSFRAARRGRLTGRGACAMTVKIMPNEKGNPPGKLAEVELHFSEGPF